MPASVRGGLMAEEYRQLTDGQKMLRYFYEELEAAFERGEPDLILMISRVAGRLACTSCPPCWASARTSPRSWSWAAEHKPPETPPPLSGGGMAL
jgi:hypothetical protein